MQKEAEDKAEKEKAAYAKMIEEREIVEKQEGLDMREMINARK